MQRVYPTLKSTSYAFKLYRSAPTAAYTRQAACPTLGLRLNIALRKTMNMPLLPTSRTQKTHGFSLIEVLVSIIVLCFGVLGAVGLQAASLQSNREAKLQAVATRYGEELAELMRGNKGVAVLTSSNPYLVAIKSGDGDPTNPNCGYPGLSACTDAATTAQRDVYEWWKRLDQALPGARVAVCQDSTPYEATSGLPQWACSGSGGVLAIKIGWTRGNTLRGATGTDATSTSTTNTGAFDRALRPGIVFPITPGSTS